LDAEAGLRAGDVGVMTAKDIERGTQLSGIGAVFRVEHGRKTAPREGQRAIQRFRFGPRVRCGCDQDLHMRHRTKPRDGGAGCEIVGFDGQDDVELFARLVECVDRLH
jgi:hypothetical protein